MTLLTISKNGTKLLQFGIPPKEAIGTPRLKAGGNNKLLLRWAAQVQHR